MASHLIRRSGTFYTTTIKSALRHLTTASVTPSRHLTTSPSLHHLSAVSSISPNAGQGLGISVTEHSAPLFPSITAQPHTAAQSHTCDGSLFPAGSSLASLDVSLPSLDAPLSSASSQLNRVECVTQPCPPKLRKGFAQLFPDLPADQIPHLTIITVSQHTENDQTAWTEDVERERDELTHTFIQEAEVICNKLRQAGYWADLIDPSCGRAYLGSHANHVLAETDDRYNQLGFHVEDLGCCKAISHSVWGTHVFVGTIFTNASHDFSTLAM